MRLRNLILRPIRTGGHLVLVALDKYRAFMSDSTWEKFMEELETLVEDLNEAMSENELNEKEREQLASFLVDGKLDTEKLNEAMPDFMARRWGFVNEYFNDFIDMQRQQIWRLSTPYFIQYCLMVAQVAAGINQSIGLRTKNLLETWLKEQQEQRENDEDGSIPFFLGPAGEA